MHVTQLSRNRVHELRKLHVERTLFEFYMYRRDQRLHALYVVLYSRRLYNEELDL